MILASVFIVLGLVLLVFAADYLVKGAANVAGVVGVSPLIVGLTVVSFGTSAPELAVSMASAFKGQADLAVGNVVGSNIFNVLVVLGLSAVIIPLVVHRQLVRFDVPVMICFSVLLYGLCCDGVISRVDGVVLFSLGLGYILYLLWQSKREGGAGILDENENEEIGKAGRGSEWFKNIGLIVLGMAGLVIGADILVRGAVTVAEFFGVSELIIGLTIISVGTSLPEVATSVVAAMKGEKDIAVGNVVGSNIFNIVLVLGLSSIVAPGGVAVSGHAVSFDMLFMVFVALGAFPVFFYGYGVGRVAGGFFLFFYVLYIVYLVLEATGSVVFPAFRGLVMMGVVPATGVCLLVLLFGGFRRRKNLA